MSARLDIQNKIFGRWTVVSFSKIYKNKAYWLCKCLCGNQKEVPSSALNGGHSKSCGCLRVETSSIIHKGQIAANRKDYGEASFNRIFRTYSQSAKKRKLPFNLTKEQFKLFIDSNCHYCNTEPSSIMLDTTSTVFGQYVYNGIDRINNLEGYENINCVSCCKTCNMLKKDLSYEDFLLYVEKIYNFRNKLNENKLQSV